MGTTQPISRAAAQAIDNLLDDCAAVQRDQHVVILAAIDGLYGEQTWWTKPRSAGYKREFRLVVRTPR